MSSAIRREVPTLLITVLGIVWAIDMILDVGPLTETTSYFYQWVTIIGSFTIFIGAVNLIRSNLRQVRVLPNNNPNKYINMWSIVLFAILVIFGMGFPDEYGWLSTITFGNLDLIMGSMLGLWLASSAARSLRTRTFESSLFLIAAVLVLMQSVPIGEVISPWLSGSGLFVLESWALAMTRAMTIGVSFGIVAMAIRTIAGFERRAIGVET